MFRHPDGSSEALAAFLQAYQATLPKDTPKPAKPLKQKQAAGGGGKKVKTDG
jgi:hypothetical protein